MCAAGTCEKTKDTLNFSAGITRGNLDIIFWGNNINDDKYLHTAFSSVGDPFASSFEGYPNAPKKHMEQQLITLSNIISPPSCGYLDW